MNFLIVKASKPSSTPRCIMVMIGLIVYALMRNVPAFVQDEFCGRIKTRQSIGFLDLRPI